MTLTWTMRREPSSVMTKANRGRLNRPFSDFDAEREQFSTDACGPHKRLSAAISLISLIVSAVILGRVTSSSISSSRADGSLVDASAERSQA